MNAPKHSPCAPPPTLEIAGHFPRELLVRADDLLNPPARSW